MPTKIPLSSISCKSTSPRTSLNATVRILGAQFSLGEMTAISSISDCNFSSNACLKSVFLAISSAKDDIERSVASANPKMLGAFSVPERKPFSCPPPYKSGFIDVPFLRINRLYPSVREFCAMISNTNQRRARANSPLFFRTLARRHCGKWRWEQPFGDFYEPCYIVDCARFVAYVHNRHKRHVFIE